MQIYQGLVTIKMGISSQEREVPVYNCSYVQEIAV